MSSAGSIPDSGDTSWQPRELLATADGAHLFHVVWEDRRGQPDTLASWFDRTETFQETASRWRAQGFHVAQITSVVEGGHVYFHSLWQRRRTPTSWSLFDNSRSLNQTWDAFTANGFAPSSIDVTTHNGEPRFHTHWTRRSGCGMGWNHRAASLARADAEHRAAGRRMTSLRGYDLGRERLYASIWCGGTVGP